MRIIFDTYAELSDYIRTHGPLPRDGEVVVGERVILPHTCGHAHECTCVLVP